MDDSKYFYVWVTAEAGSSEAQLIAALVKVGYDIDPLSQDITMYYQGSPTCVIGLRLLSLEKGVTKVYSEVHAALSNAKIQYHSLIVAEACACMWVGSNIKTEKVVSKKVTTSAN